MSEDKKHIELLEPVKAQGRFLSVGAKIPYNWIPEEQIPDLVEKGIIQVIKTVLPQREIKMVERIVSTTPKLPDISGMSVSDAQTLVSELEDLKILHQLKIVEDKGKGRKTVLTGIDRKIRELEGIGA